MSILIVDDSRSNRELLAGLLRVGECPFIQSASTAEEAFGMLGLDADGSEPSYHDGGPAPAAVELILMDIVMPGVDGVEACRRIKATERYRDVPVIMVTALEQSAHLREAFLAGATDYVVHPVDGKVLQSRVNSALAVRNVIFEYREREKEWKLQASHLENRNRRLEEIAGHDPLTGIANRRRLEAVLDREWLRNLRSMTPVSLLMIDIDHFKRANDTLGHLFGDRCLRDVAQALVTAVRRAGDLVGRFGGEEFAVLLPAVPEEGARVVGETLRQAVRSLSILVDDHPLTISVGVATIVPTNQSSPFDLLEHADKALYAAKDAGRDRVVVWPG
jgi:diguanylate cyclase (GGDEF)-like protein